MTMMHVNQDPRRLLPPSATIQRFALAFLVAGVAASLGPSAQAAQSVSLRVKLEPNRAGANATVSFGFTIARIGGGAPSPLTGVDLRFPARLSLATSTLGLATCNEAALENFGVLACPVNSRMGFGRSVAMVPFSEEPVYEGASITMLMGPPKNEHTVILLYTEAITPVAASFVFEGEVLPDTPPFGERMHTIVPLVPSLPGGADVSTVSFSSTLGPAHLTYLKHVHGQVVPYQPRGLLVPTLCPRGGFPVWGEFSFQDGTEVTAKKALACPAGSRQG
jgi:hypothetical protein